MRKDMFLMLGVLLAGMLVSGCYYYEDEAEVATTPAPTAAPAEETGDVGTEETPEEPPETEAPKESRKPLVVVGCG